MRAVILLSILAFFVAVASTDPVYDCRVVYECLEFLSTGALTDNLGFTATNTLLARNSTYLDDLQASFASITNIDIENHLNQPGSPCPYPKCPEGYTVSPADPSQCKKTTSELKGNPNMPAYGNLTSCLTDPAAGRGVFNTITTGSTSFRIRNCMQPFNKAYKDCLYKQGILG